MKVFLVEAQVMWLGKPLPGLWEASEEAYVARESASAAAARMSTAFHAAGVRNKRVRVRELELKP